MATGIHKFCLRAGGLVAAAMLLSAPAFAIVNTQTVTINSNKHSTRTPTIRKMPPTDIPAIQPPEVSIHPIYTNPGFRNGSSTGSAGSIAANSRVRRVTSVIAAGTPPAGGGSAGH